MTKSLSTRLRGLFGRRAARASHRSTTRPRIEALEDRTVPTGVSYHGGPVLPHVEVQAMYYGSEWASDPSLSAQQASLDSFLNGLVTGPYMDMLSKAGYKVGKGSADAGIVDNVQVGQNSGKLYVTEAQIRSDLLFKIWSGKLKSPDSNRLYVIYVEPNVEVEFLDGVGSNETNLVDTAAYRQHNSFLALVPNGGVGLPTVANIRYVLMPYPGGSVGNPNIDFLSAQDSLTVNTSRLVVDGVTDANADLTGWRYDWSNENPVGVNSGAYPTEIGESGRWSVLSPNVVYLGGNAVSRIIDQHDHAMTPAGAQAQHPVTFDLDSYGTLWKLDGGRWTQLATNIDKLSDQSIDTEGQAMVDIVTTSGVAYEYHEGAGFEFLSPNALDAKAGQGESYVLLNYGGGTVWQFVDKTHDQGFFKIQPIGNNVTAIDAGTDETGVNMVDVITTNKLAYAVSESTGWHFLWWNAASVSAGQQGVSAVVDTAGDAFLFTSQWGFPFFQQFLGSGVAKAAVGTDSNGNYMLDLLHTDGTVSEYRSGIGWHFLASDVSFVGKGHAGVVDLVLGDDHDLWQVSGSKLPLTYTKLDSGIESAA
jgi:hypothetical protein